MTVEIIYFSDLLCVWAYVGAPRIAEVRNQFGADVRFETRFCSVFGDSAGKIEGGWKARGGYEGFAKHVHEVAARFEVELHPDLWTRVRPASSDSAHLLLKAAQLLEGQGAEARSEDLAARLRQAFFQEGRDIATWAVQAEVAEELGLSPASLEESIRSGEAFGALAKDTLERERLGVRGSPTFILNEGRQKLYGNVGYRVIEANIQELLREPGAGGASWC